MFDKKITISALCICLIVFLSPFNLQASNLQGQKVLFIDSYHSGYPWSDGEIRGVKEVFQNTGIGLKVFQMDTKRNRDEAYIKNAALRAKAVIDSFKPNLVIAADDNASKYLVVPYLMNIDIPVVFCGVNWDAKVYGFPTKNITGVLEIDLMKQMVSLLQKFSKGKRLGTLYLNTTSAKKIISNQEKILKFKYHTVHLVDNFTEWKNKYKEMQETCDIVIIGNQQGMEDWNEQEFIDYALKHTKVPSGTTGSWRMPFTLLGYLRIPEEQGRLAGDMALKILKGAKPEDIPITSNKEAKVVINQALSEKLNISFPHNLLKVAEIIWP